MKNRLHHVEGVDYFFQMIDRDASLTIWVETGWRNLKTIHPYDLQNYHEAASKDGQKWFIQRMLDTGRTLGEFRGDVVAVLAHLRELDAPLQSHIDRS